MIDDPVEDVIRFTKYWWHRLLLSFEGSDFIIFHGDPMKIPNSVEPLTIYFERLESEPDPRRVAQLNRRYRERKLQQQLAGTVQFVSTLFASSNHK